MASSKIEQLRVQFEKLPLDKKKVFIQNLNQKLAGNKNAEYKKFLNDCIMDYNFDVKNNAIKPTQTKTSAVNAVSPAPISKKLRDTANVIVDKTSDIASNVKDEINASPAVADAKDRIKAWYQSKKIMVRVALIAFILGFVFAVIPFAPLTAIGGILLFSSKIVMIFAIFGVEKVFNALLIAGIVVFRLVMLIVTFVVPIISWGFLVIMIAFVAALTKGALTFTPPPPPTPMFGIGGGEFWGLRK